MLELLMIETQSLTKTYGNVIALQNINLRLFPNQIAGIMGPNGAGKTTLLRLISGLVKPDYGKVYISGIEVFKNPIEIKKYLGIVETDNFLYPKLTLEDHLEFIKNINKIGRKEFEKSKSEIYSILNFTNEPFVKIEELSHGNKKKCMLATATISNPDVLLLDEPLNGIDPVSSKNIKDYLKYLAYEKNKAVIISSHLIESLEKIADRIIIIKDGLIIDDLNAKKMKADKVDLEEYFVNRINQS